MTVAMVGGQSWLNGRLRNVLNTLIEFHSCDSCKQLLMGRQGLVLLQIQHRSILEKVNNIGDAFEFK